MPKWPSLITPLLISLVWTVTALFGPSASAADRERRGCENLLKAAEGLRRDLKTVNLVLDSAAEAGNAEREQAYRLKKEALQKQLDAAMKSIRAAECVNP